MSEPLSSRPLIERLIAFDTTSRNPNMALIDWVRDYLADIGVECRLSHGEENGKANLFATVGGEGAQGGIVLSGHTDVVPVDGQDWSTDPWKVNEADGLLYGRGCADMKSFIGVALAFAPAFAGRKLKRPLHLALSFDEEVGCTGVGHMLADIAEAGIRPAMCIVGEPTEMQVITAHKGKHSFYGRARGREAHSSLVHQGVNAVEAAAEVVAFMKGMARRFRDEGPYDHAYDCPFTSVHTGTLNGGTALNIVPKSALFEFEWRYLPQDDPMALLGEVQAFVDTLVPEMHAIDPDSGIELAPRSRIPALDTDEEAEVVVLAKALAGSNTVGKVSFGTEGGLFQQSGIETVICGPGSIAQAHKPDEFIALDQIARCETFMRRLLDHLSAE